MHTFFGPEKIPDQRLYCVSLVHSSQFKRSSVGILITIGWTLRTAIAEHLRRLKPKGGAEMLQQIE